MKALFKYLQYLFRINFKNNFLTLFFIFFACLFLFNFIFITNSSLNSYVNNDRLFLTSGFSSYVEYNTPPNNIGGMPSPNNLDSENYVKYLSTGIQSDWKDKNNNPFPTLYTGLKTFNPFDFNTSDSNSFMNFFPYLSKDKNSIFNNLLKYYESNGKYSRPSPESIKGDGTEAIKILAELGINLEYIKYIILNYAFLQTLYDYFYYFPNLSQPFIDFFGINLGVKYKIDENGKKIWYYNNAPTNNIIDVLISGIYQQFPDYMKSNFNNGNFSSSYSCVSYVPKSFHENFFNEKFTYLNGTFNNKKTQIWGINGEENNNNYIIKKNNKILNNYISDDSTNGVFNKIEKNPEFKIKGNLSTIIPVIINKKLADSNHLSRNSIFTFPIDNSRAQILKSNNPDKSEWVDTKPENFWGKSYSISDIINYKKPIVGGWWYYNEYKDDDKFNSVSYLFNHNNSNYPSINKQISSNVDKMRINYSKLNLHLKVCDISDNASTTPIIYTNKNIANLLHGMTINGKYGTDTKINKNEFNGKFSTLKSPLDAQSNVNVYSPLNDYSYIGLSGNPVGYYPKNAYDGSNEPGFFLSLTHSDKNAPNNNEISNNEKIFDNDFVADKSPPIVIFNRYGLSGISYLFSKKMAFDNFNNIQYLLSQILTFCFVIIGFSCFLLLFFIFRLTIGKNKKFILLFKALGFNSKKIILQIFIPCSSIAIISALFAYPSSFFISSFIIELFLNNINFPFIGISINLYYWFVSLFWFIIFYLFLIFCVWYKIFKIKAVYFNKSDN